MLKWLKELDRILRGDATRMDELRKDELRIPLRGLSAVILALAAFYAVCMGFYSMFRPDGPLFAQAFATFVKVPALFFLTLLVTFPSLYVFNALVGSRLNLVTIFRLLVAALAVNVAVLASLGPIVAFFSVSTENYGFMVILNVLTFALSGVLGFAFLLQTLNRLDLTRRKIDAAPSPETSMTVPPAEMSAAGTPETEKSEAEKPKTDPDYEWIKAEAVGEPGALDPIGDYALSERVRKVFICWVGLFALVGAQMSWVLRPFIGAPNTPFAWFRDRGSNFFEAVVQTFFGLFK
jgi:hypothetical protein